MGAEVVAGDVDDPASIAKAFEGAYGAYCVTFFWAHMDPEREKREAKALADGARAAGVQHVVWSTLEDTRKCIPLEDQRMPSIGNYKVPHFDAKAEADAYFEGLTVTYFLTAFYWDNFIGFGMGPARGEDGVLALNLPMADKELSGIVAEDIGRCAYGVFKKPEFIGKRVGIAGDHLTGQQLADAFTKHLGEKVVYNAVPFDVYRGFGFPGADDLGNMFQFYSECNEEFKAARSVDFSRSLNPRLQSFDSWLQENAAAIPR